MTKENEGLWAWKQGGNNNRIIDFQARQMSSSAEGEIEIEFFGGSAFRIRSPSGLTLFIDPWRNLPSGGDGQMFRVEMPIVQADIGISTHAHYDHDALHRLEAGMLLDRLAGCFEFADVRIVGIADKHVSDYSGCLFDFNAYFVDIGVNPFPPDNPRGYDNTLTIVETGGLRILHWGDNRPNPPEEIWQKLGRIDVLLLPVDESCHVLTYPQCDEVLKRLNPRVCIPHHYFVRKVNRVISTLKDADSWVTAQKDFEYTNSSKIVLDGNKISRFDKKIIYFKDNVAFPV